jgi:hypothetical protein
MKQIRIDKLGLLLVIFIIALTTMATKWSDYGDMGDGVIADGDTFLIRDISDDSLGGTGTQKEYTYEDMKIDLSSFDAFEFPNDNDTTSLVDEQAEAAHDNNNPGIAVHDGSNVRYYATRTKCFEPVVLAEPDQLQPISDIWTILSFPAEQYPVGFIIEAIQITTSANCGDALNFEEWTNTNSWSLVETVEAITLDGDTFTEDDGTLSSATMAADSYLRVDLPASPTDIASYEITVCGQIPVNN